MTEQIQKFAETHLHLVSKKQTPCNSCRVAGGSFTKKTAVPAAHAGGAFLRQSTRMSPMPEYRQVRAQKEQPLVARMTDGPDLNHKTGCTSGFSGV